MIKDTSREFIKIIAILAMFIDHIGWLILPSYPVFRIIGRIAMPCYGYLIGQGIKSTHNIKLYFWRLFALAVISQIGFIRFNPDKLNIIFTFAFTVAAVNSFKTGKYLKMIIYLIILAIAPLEFGIYAFLSVILLQFSGRRPVITAIVYAVISAVCGIIYKLSPEQCFATLAVPVIYFAPKINLKFKIPKYLWRLFYPVQWWFFVIWRYLCTGS